jgi:uncharacterized membrane protein
MNYDEPEIEVGVISAYGHALKRLPESFLVLSITGLIYTLVSALTAGVTFLLIRPLGFGIAFVHLKAVREESPQVEDMFEPFKDFINVVFAGFLVFVVVFIGFCLLIIPGIYFACKLAFTPYIVVDRKMGALDAMKESWDMTNGCAFKVFMIGFWGVPLYIIGLCFLVVGVIPAIMLTQLAFAALYHAVDTEDVIHLTTEDPLYI